MSGGHFDYDDSRLDYLADQLEQDIKYNAVPWDNPIKEDDDEEYYGFQLETKTIEYLKGVARQLRELRRVLHEYDYAVSGDTCEKTFQERVGIK
jgi:hypothetical protein